MRRWTDRARSRAFTDRARDDARTPAGTPVRGPRSGGPPADRGERRRANLRSRGAADGGRRPRRRAGDPPRGRRPGRACRARRHSETDQDVRGGGAHRRAGGPARATARRDGHGRGRWGPRPHRQRLRPESDPARATRRGDGHARDTRRAHQPAMTAEKPLPIGTVTFFRTDVEGSMGLARTLGREWDAVNATHLGLIRSAVDANGGVCVRTEGDAFFGVFPEAGLAVTAAAEAQRALVAHHWPDGASVRVRMGLHSGEAHLAGDDYGGFEVNRAARVSATGHGGQIVMSEPTRTLVEPALAGGMGLRDLGRHVLRDLPAPEHLYQLVVPGLPAEFPPLRTTGSGAGNLPARMTSFVGRDAALAEVDGLWSRNRLVTLTGPGGIGKTSLA